MHLSNLGLVPLLFALGTRSQTFVSSVTNTDGTLGVLRGCYQNIWYSFVDTTGGSTPGSIELDSQATSIQACVQACSSSGSTYAIMQGYNSK